MASIAYASTIIYVNTKQEADDLALFFKSKGAEAEAYHAGHTSDARDRVYDNFKNDKTQIVCCTVAFL